MDSLALYFHGPLQSWAGPSLVKTRVDTNRKPSERAIAGLIAAAYGMERTGSMPASIRDSEITIESLSAGRVVKDFQIISNRPGEEEYIRRIAVATKERNLVAPNKKTMIVNRTYLADAKFIVFVSGKNQEDTEDIYAKMLSPVWSPYLGKRAFAPTFPFILGLVPTESRKERALELIAQFTGASK